jgi:zinc/manganese transport system ATP-binding protein
MSIDPAVRVRGQALALRDATLRFGERTIWEDLTVEVEAGEFLTVLGPNGSGKTSLLKVLLGLQPLSRGSVTVGGDAPRRGSDRVGYVPQQKAFDPGLPLRGRDLVGLGLDGHRWGFSRVRADRGKRIEEALAAVGAQHYAAAPIGLLSGGEQQRLRIAQAILSDPTVLLCDEPLLSLDLGHQQAVAELLDERRRTGTAVVFVTHEVNPVLPLTDRVLYLVGGRWAIGSPDEVMTTQTLSELYGTRIDVLRVGGRIVVVGAPDSAHSEPGGAHHHHAENDDHDHGPGGH